MKCRGLAKLKTSMGSVTAAYALLELALDEEDKWY